MEFVKFRTAFSLDQIVALAGKLIGRDALWETQIANNPARSVLGVTNGRNAAPDALCFVEKQPDPDSLLRLQSAVVITNRQTAPLLSGCTLIITDDPRALFIDCIEQIRRDQGFADFTSLIDAAPGIHPHANIHPGAIIEDGVRIGAATYIAAGCVIKQGSCIGDHVIVRENTVIGTDGIALYKANDGRMLRFPHLAGVLIEDNVEIGASCVISRGVLNSTKVGKDSVIGNLSNLGHAAQIGAKVWMSVGCMIGGNSSIGDRTSLGLGVFLRDNIKVGNDCSIGMGSVVVNDLPDHHSVFGNPARRLPEVKAGPDR
jgi:UDP-3-O-[3-hydroxymyristoyl] glucosamine N-acyltransferase